MGQGESTNVKPFMAEPYIVINSDDDVTPSSPISNKQSFVSNDKILTTGFNATWTMSLPNSITPRPRTSHFMAYVPELNCAYAGYGIDGDDNLLNDIWILNLSQMTWEPFEIDNKTIVPRNGTTAVLVNSTIFLFGGFSGDAYLSDLHTIDIRTLNVRRPNTICRNNTKVQSPAGRIGHAMAEHNGQILIWGGYNGDWLSDLWLLDTTTMEWREIQTEIKGRTSTAFANHGEYLYIFGASKSDGLLRYSWISETLEYVKTTGSAPPSELSAASMVAVDRYLLLFGGKIEKKKYGLMYGFDTVRNWWFVFHAMPDGQSTSLIDGYIDRNGFFMVPRIWSASIVYRQKRRDAVLFLGAPLLEPPNLCTVGLGDALGVLHLQNDLFEALYYL